VVEGKALLGDLLEFASVVEGIGEMMAAELLEVKGQVLDRYRG